MKRFLPILLLVFSVGVGTDVWGYCSTEDYDSRTGKCLDKDAAIIGSNESVIVSCELTGGWVKDTVVLDFNFDEKRVVCWKNDLKASIKGGWGSIQGLAPRCNITGNQIELRTHFQYSTFMGKARLTINGSAALYVDIETGNAKSQFAYDEYSIMPTHSFPEKSPAEIRRWETESALKGQCRKDGRAWIGSNQSGSSSRATGKNSLELEFWQTIKESDDPDMYREYLRLFPEGVFSGLAKLKIKKLGGTLLK